MQKLRLAMVANDLNINGISTVIMNYCMNINLDEFDISIIAGIPIDNGYREKYEALGISVISLPARKTDSMQYYLALKKEFANGYDIVHVHGNSATMAIELLLAKQSGIQIRIAHCHNSTCRHKGMHTLLLPLFRYVYTDGFACSLLAGKWIFRDKQFEVITNGFEVGRFHFSLEKRAETRKKLETENAYLIGHVGRFNEQKNHPFILKLFEEYAGVNDKAVLLLVGDGPDFSKIEDMVARHPYKDRIILFGEAIDIAALYSAMDIFIMPSKHEGLGIAALEAQISGLPCLVSDAVPKDVIIGSEIHFCRLVSTERWLGLLQKYGLEFDSERALDRRKAFYQSHGKEIGKWDIKKNAYWLQMKYQELYRRNEVL